MSILEIKNSKKDFYLHHAQREIHVKILISHWKMGSLSEL